MRVAGFFAYAVLAVDASACHRTASPSDAGASIQPTALDASAIVTATHADDASAGVASAACPDTASQPNSASTKPSFERGVSLARTGRWADALPLPCSAAAADASAETLGELDWVQFHLGDLVVAEQTTRRGLTAATFSKQKGPLYFNFGKILVVAGKRTDAIAAFKSSMAENPSSAAAAELRALGEVVAGNTATGADPIPLNIPAKRLTKVEDFCHDALRPRTLSCKVDATELVDHLTEPFRHVNLLEYTVENASSFSLTTKYLVVETSQGRFIVGDALGLDGANDEPNETVALKVDDAKLVPLVGGAQALAFAWSTSAEGVFDGKRSGSFTANLLVCASGNQKLSCSTPLVYDSSEDEPYALTYDFPAPGELVFGRTPGDGKKLPDAARALLGRHSLVP